MIFLMSRSFKPEKTLMVEVLIDEKEHSKILDELALIFYKYFCSQQESQSSITKEQVIEPLSHVNPLKEASSL